MPSAATPRLEPVRSPGIDVLLYGSSAAFAFAMLASAYVRNRTWAAFALPAYGGGALASLLVVALAARLGGRRTLAARVFVAAVVAAGAVIAPLAAEVHWRAERGPEYAASEVVVTERAGAALAGGRDPYAALLDSTELARSPSTVGHFPYLPGMALFGFPRAYRPGAAWTDARLFFAIAATLAAGVALCCWPGSAAARLRAAQVLVVLPTGADALVVGGDDVPVLALSLLALVLFRRRRHTASAAAAGLAGLLKLTAWPLMFALAAVGCARGRRARSPFVLAPLAVVVTVLAAAAASPAAFAEDVVLFPQGLTSLRSPAASTTVGSLVAGGLAPRGVATWLLLAAALLVSGALLVGLARRPSAPPHAPAWVAAGILLTLIMLAPAARAGYFVYPLELVVWAALLREQAPARRPARAARQNMVEEYAG
jgi:hypothetical protein